MKISLNQIRLSLAIPGCLALQLLAGGPNASASDLHVSIPERSISTPTQRLNREGVAQLKHGHQEEAKRLFYKAYLLDPNDPFTLNNLGYVAELEGDVDRAQRFYDLAADQSSAAIVDRADADGVVGKSVTQVAGRADENNMQVNRLNVQALGLLLKDRAPEADVILTK